MRRNQGYAGARAYPLLPVSLLHRRRRSSRACSQALSDPAIKSRPCGIEAKKAGGAHEMIPVAVCAASTLCSSTSLNVHQAQGDWPAPVMRPCTGNAERRGLRAARAAT
jgi:hypothetical protein